MNEKIFQGRSFFSEVHKKVSNGNNTKGYLSVGFKIVNIFKEGCYVLEWCIKKIRPIC
jgi:hypothetical protein